MNVVCEPPRFLLFTGKGGVGKTSIACASALALADAGRRVLVVSTDPASNLGEVLAAPVGTEPTAVDGAPRLFALNLDPLQAAQAYRERVVGPYRGLLPEASVRSIEEQLSGACTVEIAAFDEFSKLVADPTATSAFDHVVFDTAPTGHTLRLLELPAAWSSYIEDNAGGVSCLGPLSGLSAQKGLYEAARRALADAAETRLVLVSRPEEAALKEAERTRRELEALGISRAHLVINGLFSASDPKDGVALALELRGRRAMEMLGPGLALLPRTEFPLLPQGLLGVERLRALRVARAVALDGAEAVIPGPELPPLDALLPELERHGNGVILTLGKGGVGKTSVALRLAQALAQRGHRVHLTTTDPAADAESLRAVEHEGLEVSRIDTVAETLAYSQEVLAGAGAALDGPGRALLEEELRSPCTEEIAVFRAFARIISEGERKFVVVDTAPTGHTLLLLDAAEAYHREVLRSTGHVSDEVRELLPRLRNPEFARMLIVTLPEATPVHEAEQLQRDLSRASIVPFAWIVNQSLTPLRLSDPVLRARRAAEARHLSEVCALAERVALVPFDAGSGSAVQTQQPAPEPRVAAETA